MQGIADRFDLSAKINACVYCQSLINPFNIDIKSELGCENLFPFYPWLLLPLSAFLYNESIKTQGRGNYDKAASHLNKATEAGLPEAKQNLAEMTKKQENAILIRQQQSKKKQQR